MMDLKRCQLHALFAVIWISTLIRDSEQGAHEERLFHNILKKRNINKLARPVADENQAVEVQFGISLQQIIDVDEKNEMLHTNLWLNYLWYDYKLGWNKSEYGNVSKILVPAKMLWTPDILLYNSVDEDIDSKFPTNLVLYPDGSVNWVPPGIYISSCSIDIRWFPFDEQKCKLKFGSWTYDGSKINLTKFMDKIDMSVYQESGEWKVLDTPAILNRFKYDCCPEEYLDISFYIIIRRRALYYAFNLIIPCSLISSMTLLTFALPPDAGEKISLGVTILLSLSVFLLIVAESVPATSLALPLLGIYFACIMMMCTVSVIMTTLVLNFHHRTPEMYACPGWVRTLICEWLAWILRMKRPGRDLTKKGIDRKASMRDLEMRKPVSSSLLSNVLDHADDEVKHAQNCYPLSSIRVENKRFSDFLVPREELSLILKELRFITNKMREDAEADDEIGDWKFAAMVIDRLCLYIFGFYTLVATTVIFFSVPNIFD